MTSTTTNISIDKTGTTNIHEANLIGKGKTESELRAVARQQGLTLKELASLMGVNYNHLCSVANGRRPWTPMLRERATAVLGEVPGQGIVYRQGGLIQGESTYIREQARALGMTQKDLADVVGVSTGYMSEVCRGRRNMSPSVQARVEAALGGPVVIAPAECANRRGGPVKGESTWIRERARALGLAQKDLAKLVGVSVSYLSQVARGRRNMSPAVQARVEAVLGGPVEIAPAECANRPVGVVKGTSTYIRERARELGMSLKELARRVGISFSYMSMVARGLRNMSPALQARVEAALEATVRVEAAQLPTVDQRALWDRMDAHGLSQNEVARRAGISPSYLSHIMNGTRVPSGEVLRRLHEVLFKPSSEELVVPAEVKVMAWKKGGRNGVVVKGAGGPGAGRNPGGGTVRIGGWVPWGAEVEYAYRAGYDSRGRVSVTHLVDERGYGKMLTRPEPGAA